MAQLPKSEFVQALSAVAAERGIDSTIVIESIKAALVAAYIHDAKEHDGETEDKEFEGEISPDTGEAKIFLILGDGKKQDVTPPGFGRIAAQTARQVIRQKIREAERDAVISGFEARVGQLVSGVVLRFDGQSVRIDLGKTEGIMPAGERIGGERLEGGQRLMFLIKEIQETERGRDIILTRADPLFIQKLFEREVPEIASHAVEIRAIAREAGVRTKIAVGSKASGVDPVGSCVGQKGVRVQTVINEVNGEKIDVIPWVEDPAQLITVALSPAQNLQVRVDKNKKTARVLVPREQLSVAIGKDGQNVRLASRLVGYTIDVQGTGEPEKVKKIEEEKENLG